MSSKDNLSMGDRFKNYYENCYKTYLPRRMPLIIRLDGKAFHTLTRNCEKLFDKNIINLMDETAKYLCENIQGAQLAYVQSDEISILVHNYKRLTSSAWFDNELQKIVSVSASLATSKFNYHQIANKLKQWNEEDRDMDLDKELKLAHFDSRAFVLPENEVCNYFLWRQKDWERNSIQMLARSLYSHKELQGKKHTDLQEMCFQKGHNWNDLEISLKRGRCIVKEIKYISTEIVPMIMDNCVPNGNYWIVDNEIPIFKDDRNYIEKWLEIEEE